MHLEIEAEHGEGGVEGTEKEVRHHFVAQHISSLKARIRPHLIEKVPNQTEVSRLNVVRFDEVI